MSEERDSDLAMSPTDDTAERPARRQAVRGAKIVTAVVLVLLVVGAGRTVMSRMSNSRALEANSTEHAKLYVKTGVPKSNEAGQTLALPGALVQGYRQPRGERRSPRRNRCARN
jgi:hypothetical protein